MTKHITVASICIALAGAANAQSIISFDVPGAAGTTAAGILPTGEIVGSWNNSGGTHGFIRRTDGSFTTFDVPGASSTSVNGFNAAGDMVGHFIDTAQAFHGYVRARGGVIATFDVPGAGSAANQGTIGLNINPSGLISGQYVDSAGQAHSFIGTPGRFTSFDAPGAMGTFSASIDALNPQGDMVGGFPDAQGVNHGYLRTAAGAITQIDGPGQSQTFVTGIDSGGVVVGAYFDSAGGHGFLRARSGLMTTFEYPGAISTFVANISTSGQLAGLYVDYNGTAHGLVGLPTGWTVFDVPGAGTGQFQGTIPRYNDASNRVVGYWLDSNYVSHGFLRTN